MYDRNRLEHVGEAAVVATFALSFLAMLWFLAQCS
jgi:hypothetical protein